MDIEEALEHADSRKLTVASADRDSSRMTPLTDDSASTLVYTLKGCLKQLMPILPLPLTQH